MHRKLVQAITFTTFTLIMLNGCGGTDTKKHVLRKGQASVDEISLIEKDSVQLHAADETKIPVAIYQFQATQNHYLSLEIMTQHANVFARSGRFIQSIGGPGQGPGEFRMPGGFAQIGNRYHISSANSEYIVYNLDGNFMAEINDLLPGGIPNKIIQAPEDTALVTHYSRYSEDATISHITKDGQLLGKFSPPDEDFKVFWDMVHPMGNIIAEESRILQSFIHRYEILIFDYQGNLLEKVSLASPIYRVPDYKEAHRISKKKKRKNRTLRSFNKTHTQITGLFKVGDNYVTQLIQTSLGDGTVLEVWDNQFMGLGRILIPEGHEVVGSENDALILFNPEKASLLYFQIGLSDLDS